MAANGYGATALTGGTSGCLDAINGALLKDGDVALVKTATLTYEFILDADSAAAENSPEIISPDTNAGDKRWVRTKYYVAAPGDIGQTTPAKIAGTQIRWAKGTDVASANALTLGTDGNYFDITGTTAITSIGTLGAGAFVILHFDGALTLTHHATDLILPSAANITTAAGDEAMFEEYATGDWRCVNYSKADGTAIVGGGGVATDTIWDAAGDIVYGTGADTAARLALGAANLSLFVNAGATAPEWANGMKSGATSIDSATASGTQAITGVGFKPSYVIFQLGGGATAEMSLGFDNGTSYYCTYDNHTITADSWERSSTYSIAAVQGSGITYTGLISSLDADGFTITWTKTGAKTGTIYLRYLAFR